MATETKRTNHRWSKESVRKLKLQSRTKSPVAKISKQTKRTITGLRQLTHQMDLSLGHKR